MVNAALIDTLPLPQRLALSYAPPRAKPLILGFLALDARLAEIVRVRREPIAAQMRLAWWRERLADEPTAWPRGEPLLEALAAWTVPSRLAQLPDAWELLLGESLTGDAIAEHIAARANGWRGIALELGTEDDGSIGRAGHLWAAADLATHLTSSFERALAVAEGNAVSPHGLLPARLRPLAVLAELARASLAKGGAPLLAGPGSALLALRTGLLGR